MTGVFVCDRSRFVRVLNYSGWRSLSPTRPINIGRFGLTDDRSNVIYLKYTG